MTEQTGSEMDPAIPEIIDNALQNIADEMQATVMNAAYSPLWQEAGDLSNALLTSDGSLIAQSDRVIPVHLATMTTALRATLEDLGGPEALQPGDVLIQNNPYKANNHIPDVLLAKPVFVDGEILAFSTTRGHWVDSGGRYPTSHCPAVQSIYEEGLILPTMKAYENDELDPILTDLIENNVRQVDQTKGNLNAQKAGVDRGERRLHALVERHDAPTIRQAMSRILDNSEAEMRTAIEDVPDGTYTASDQIDNDGLVDQPHTIDVSITVDGNTLVADFDGSDPQVEGGMNAPWGTTLCAVYYAIVTVLTPWGPGNSGHYRPITVTAPEGTLVRPKFPAPVVAGHHETTTRIVDVIVEALAEAVPAQAYAAGDGSSNILAYFGGDEDEQFQYITVHGGGSGAHLTGDGRNGIRNGVGNSSISSIETEEATFPVRVERFGFEPDSGGPGQHRGGNTLTRTTRFLEDMEFFIVGERAYTPPYGLEGGQPGERAKHVVERSDGTTERLPSKTSRIPIEEGSAIHYTPAGGGGYGDPYDRPPEQVLADVQNGYVTVEAARAEYGVAIERTGHGFELDHEQTDTLRTSHGE